MDTTKSRLRLTGRLSYRVLDAHTGQWGPWHHQHNLVTLAGRNLVRDLLRGESVDGIGYVALGTGTTAAAAGDTTLETEVYRAPVTITTYDDGEVTFRLFLPTTGANGSTITEAGLLTAETDGTLYARALLDTALAKDATKAAEFTWVCTFADA